ncbi:hypothetical protein ACJMK2_029774 [Sinanodonta woodiana]|uniref:Uncharacterized protein n=1 Tax=Sinanodonta woodiana TaxID=1069815 RepID=A0ABD3XCQ9_SINWO
MPNHFVLFLLVSMSAWTLMATMDAFDPSRLPAPVPTTTPTYLPGQGPPVSGITPQPNKDTPPSSR